MSAFFTQILHRLRHFRANEAGTVVAEAVIVLPLFLWAYIGLYVYWDSFRSANTAQKAAYTISDILSREQAGINTTYIDGLSKLAEYLIDNDQSARLRVSSVTWNDTDKVFELHWSASPNNTMTPLTNASLQDYATSIPGMSPGDTVIVLEMEVDFKPAFDIGIAGFSEEMEDMTFRQFVVTRPRFLPCLPLNGLPCPTA